MSQALFTTPQTWQVVYPKQALNSGATQTVIDLSAFNITVARIRAWVRHNSVVTPVAGVAIGFQSNGNTNFDSLYSGVFGGTPTSFIQQDFGAAIGLQIQGCLGNNAAADDYSAIDITIFDWNKSTPKQGYGFISNISPSIPYRLLSAFSFNDKSAFPYNKVIFNAGSGSLALASALEVIKLE